MGSKVASDTQAGFSGGLNTAGDPNFLRPDQATQLQNIKLSRIGAATKRNGTQYVATSAIGVAWGGGYWQKARKVFLYGVSGDDLYYSGTTSYPLTWSAISSGASSMTDATPFIAPNAAEWLYCITNTGLIRWDGSAGSFTASTGTQPANLDSLVVYNDRLWGYISHPSTSTNVLYYGPLASTVGSAGGDGLGDAALGGGAIAIRTFTSSALKRVLPVGASLVIFHQRGVSRLSGFGQDDINVEPQGISDSVSLTTRNAACVYKDMAWALTTNGLYQVTESDFAPVGTPKKPDPTVALIQAASINVYATCTFNDVTREVYCTFTGTGVDLNTTTTYIYNTLLGAWSGPFTGTFATIANNVYGCVTFGAFDVAKTLNGNFIGQVWGQDLSGNVFQADAAAYWKDGVAAAGTGGSAFTTVIQSHRMFGGSRTLAKSWRWANLLATLTSGATAPTVASTSQYGGTSTVTLSNLTSATKPYYVSIGGTGPFVDLTITDTGTAASQYELVEVEGHLLGKR